MRVRVTVLMVASIIASSFILLGPDSALAGPRKVIKKVVRGAKKIKNVAHRIKESRHRSRSAPESRVVEPNIVKTSRVAATTNQPPDDDFESKCLIKRDPDFNEQPALHFYSYATHSDEATRLCGQNVDIQLKTIDGDLTDKPELDLGTTLDKLVDSDLFDPTVETYFITHGFQAKWNESDWMCNLKDLILNNNAANVFLVDWSGGSKPDLPFDYSAAVSNTEYVGALLGEFMRSLVEQTGQPDASQYHLIGHSLGAHISGYAGYYLDGTVGRITGLDPAGPCFSAGAKTMKTAVEDGYIDNGSRRLSRQSAQSVLALHTDTPLFGLKQNCGHFDVYVNGGRKQPGCGSTDAIGRLEDLFSLNLKDYFNLNIGCCHSFSYKLLNKFISTAHRVFPNREPEAESSGKEGSNGCYPMAYECANYKAFKAGECGFCQDGDTRCIYAGLGSPSYEANAAVDSGYGQDATDDEQDDDEQFNDEDDGDEEQDVSLAANEVELYSRGKHFMKAGAAPATCLYHYQIIIAARKEAVSELKDANKYIYYLHIPLELSGKLTDGQGKRLNDRLVQVSHKLKPNTTATRYLMSTYLDAMTGQQDSTPRDELEFYTALITFEPIHEEAKCRDDPTNGAGRKDKWQICSPLDNIQEARLWSSSETKLEAVAWVGMNFLSGLQFEERLRQSYKFNRIVGDPIRTRSEIDKSSQAKLTETTPDHSNSIGNAVDSAAGKIDCLLSVFDHSDSNGAKRNRKCNRSSKELVYAIDLSPSKLESAQQ